MGIFLIGLIIPTIVTILVPIFILFFILTKNSKIAFKEAINLSWVAIAVFSIFGIVTGFLGYTIVLVGTPIIWVLLVAVLTGISYMISERINNKRKISLTDRNLWLVMAVVVAAEYLLPLIGLYQYTMSVV